MAEPWAWDTPFSHCVTCLLCVAGALCLMASVTYPGLCVTSPGTGVSPDRRGQHGRVTSSPSSPPPQGLALCHSSTEGVGIKPAAVSFPAPWLQSGGGHKALGSTRPRCPPFPYGWDGELESHTQKERHRKVTPRGHSSMARRKSSSSSSAMVIGGGGAGGGRPSCLPRARSEGARGCPLHMM